MRSYDPLNDNTDSVGQIRIGSVSDNTFIVVFVRVSLCRPASSFYA
ncbi:hypothetical protein F442_18220 [Phytophthora nicotianae P10297]|uniref:Uncharacterized protein n=1 Tax=Phytophthora nicotianae P10297 TaxID=1317064 RepID=W2YE27_PHYNI|nr:hypothetical protein F442_18220 [Phytophthora nicotianae P10297]